MDVRRRRCCYEFCRTDPSFNVEGSKTTAYCKQHAQDGMVGVSRKRCLHEFCRKRPSFNVEGSKSAAYRNMLNMEWSLFTESVALMSFAMR